MKSVATSSVPVSSRLGEMLVEAGALTRKQLDHALMQQRQLKQPLGKTLVQLNYVTDEQMKQALATQLNVPFVDLEKMIIDRGLGRLINRSYARRHSLLPIAKFGRTLTVAMDDPTAAAVIAELSRLTGFTVTVVTASSRAITRGAERLYDDLPEPTFQAAQVELIAPVSAATDVSGGAFDEQQSRRADELFRAVLYKAIQERTSDVHLELLSGNLQIRFRVDGVLRQPNFDRMQAQLDRGGREVISRIKILSKLDIAERRRPQDGSFQVAVDRKGKKEHIDLRVSCVPSYSGESVVIRILDRARTPRGLSELDLLPDVAAQMEAILNRPTGIFLVTGPTGSGKSTTMHACLMRLHRPEIRILTAEDPVEYVYDGISQSEVNDEIGNTFAAYLRAFLRHDPEVILVGEIRDEETAEMAFRAAQTGHLLLSTLHTNSAIAALPRLIDLKVEPSLIASSLIGVLSQRLVRRVCKGCATAVPAPREASELFTTVPADVHFVEGRGCTECGFSGFRGRMMLADLWVPDDEDMRLITRQAPFSEIEKSAQRTTISMATNAHARLRAGQTTAAELFRVLPYHAACEHRAKFSA